LSRFIKALPRIDGLCRTMTGFPLTGDRQQLRKPDLRQPAHGAFLVEFRAQTRRFFELVADIPMR
jgi:hypothetical protein